MLKYPRILLTAGPRLLWDYAIRINGYAAHPERVDFSKRYPKIRSLILFILDHYRIDWKIEGLEYLQSLNESHQTFLLTANHLSDLDPLALIYWSEAPLSVVAKKETRKMPFIGTAVKALDGYFMDRGDLRQSLQVIRGVQSRLEEKHCSYLIFPEGTRNRKPYETGIAPFHPGTFKAAMATHSPILPVALFGTQRPFQPRPDYRRNLVQFTYFKPIMPADYEGKTTQEVADFVQTEMQAELDKMKAVDKAYFAAGYEKVPLRKGPLLLK